MDWILTLILVGTYYVVLIPLYFVEVNLCKPKKNIMLGVTVPHAHQESVEVQAITGSYRKRLRIFVVILGILGLSLFVMPYMSVQITVMLTLTLAVILGSMLIFIKANRALMALKKSSGWQSGQKSAPVVDLRALSEASKPLPRIWIAIPCIVAAIPLIPIAIELVRGSYDWEQILAYGATVIWIPLMVAMAEAFRRQSGEIVGAISDFNLITTRIRRRAYMRMMIASIWLLALTASGIWFEMTATQPQMILLALVGILSVLMVVYAIHAEFAVRRAQEKFTQLAGDTLEIDTDEYWIWGMFYYKNGGKLLENDRVGMNMSMNLARPLGKLSMGLAALAILAMPFIGGWTIVQEFSPVTYSMEGNTITVTHVTSRQIDLGRVTTAELLDEWPDGLRTGGTAIGTLRQGRFQLDGIDGTTWVALRTDETPLIFITTADGGQYLFNYDPVFTHLRNIP